MTTSHNVSFSHVLEQLYHEKGAKLVELEERYIVLKKSDIDLALTREQKIQLSQMCYTITAWRESLSKPLNRYVVINQDEPYFPEVLKLMEAHHDQEARAADTARRRREGAQSGWEIRRDKPQPQQSVDEVEHELPLTRAVNKSRRRFERIFAEWEELVRLYKTEPHLQKKQQLLEVLNDTLEALRRIEQIVLETSSEEEKSK